jgi:TonB family protein
MKPLYLAAAATLGFALQLAPAGAAPTVKVLSLAPINLSITAGGSRCTSPASVAGEPYAEMPAIAAEEGAAGSAQVRIRLTSTGVLDSATLFASSGNRWLDDAALRSARLTRFSPEIQQCRAVGGSYLYEVDF